MAKERFVCECRLFSLETDSMGESSSENTDDRVFEKGFEVLHRRHLVEWMFGLLCRYCRLSKDYKR